MSRNSEIIGEYTRISQKTSCYEQLDRLHDTTMTQADALDLVQHLAQTFKIQIGKVVFKPRHLGRAMWRTRNIILPATPKCDSRRVGFLRVGIVVHEVSHLLALQRGCKNHGEIFVKTLDELALYVDQYLYQIKAA